MTYSCIASYTTIGAAAFHFRVRDGIGWGHRALVARERVEGRGSCMHDRATLSWGSGRNELVLDASPRIGEVVLPEKSVQGCTSFRARMHIKLKAEAT